MYIEATAWLMYRSAFNLFSKGTLLSFSVRGVHIYGGGVGRVSRRGTGSGFSSPIAAGSATAQHRPKFTNIYIVAYFCHHLSDNYVDLSDLFVVLSDLYVEFSDLYVDLSLILL